MSPSSRRPRSGVGGRRPRRREDPRPHGARPRRRQHRRAVRRPPRAAGHQPRHRPAGPRGRAYFGQGTPNYQPFPKGYVAYDESLDDLYPYDVDAARDLLAAAGHPDGLEIELGITEDASAIAEVLQAQWAEAGIDATITVLPPNANNYVNRTYPFVLDSYSGRQSPLQALEVLYGPQGLMNLGRNTPDELLAAIDAARADADRLRRVRGEAAGGRLHGREDHAQHVPLHVAAHPRPPGRCHGIQHWIDVQRWEDVKIADDPMTTLTARATAPASGQVRSHAAGRAGRSALAVLAQSAVGPAHRELHHVRAGRGQRIRPRRRRPRRHGDTRRRRPPEP